MPSSYTVRTSIWVLEYHWEDLPKTEHHLIIYSAEMQQNVLEGWEAQARQLCAVLAADAEQTQHLASQEVQTGLTTHALVQLMSEEVV